MAKKKTEKVFHPKEGSSKRIAKEFVAEASRVSFDAHDVTRKCIAFGKLLTGTALYTYQEVAVYRIIYSLVTLEGANISMIYSRQSGKSEALAFVINTVTVLLPALSTVFKELEQYSLGVHIGLFAPQADQVWTTYNRALVRLDNANAIEIMADPDLRVELNHISKYLLSNGSSLTGQVASKQSKIEGKTYHIIFCEEAQDLDSFIVQKSIEPMLTATNGTMIKCGTTGTEKNDYYYSIQFNRSESRKFRDERLNLHFQFNYKDVIKHKKEQFKIDGKLFHLNYEKFVETQKRKLGEDSLSFQLAYALEWGLDSGMLITDKDWENMLDRRKGFSCDQDDIVIGGLDIGKEHAPSTLCFAKLVWDPDDESGIVGKEIIGWVEIPHGMDYDTQHHYIIESLQEMNCVNLVADYTGVGKAVVDRLAAATNGVVNIEPMSFSKQSKSDMWYNLIQHIQSGRLIVPANKTVRSTTEFRNFEQQMRSCLKWFDGPYIVAQKPDGGNDEHCDALGMMCLGDNFEVPAEVEVLDNPFFEDSRRQVFLGKRMSWQ